MTIQIYLFFLYTPIFLDIFYYLLYFIFIYHIIYGVIIDIFLIFKNDTPLYETI